MKHAREDLTDILEKSEQSVDVYLDDLNEACNSGFVSLLGYDSTSEWTAVEKNFPEASLRKALQTVYSSFD